MPEQVNTSALTIEGSSHPQIDERDTMIRVDHVSMVFNMASEQLNSLKEYFIQIARGKLFFKGFTALDDISFEVKRGDVFGIMGTNGSGKCTLLKIIAGVLEPTKGSCEINGNIAPLIELGAGFDTELSARENIYLNGALLGYSRSFIDDHFDEIVEFAEIEKFLDMPLKNYSSGMVSRIAFAIATVIVPEILIVDEVLSVGDFMFQKKCEDRIKDLIERHGVTVLIVSHSNEQIARLCNKAIWIEKGHTRLFGDAKTVCQIYGALGGRIGSSDSETRVFKSVMRSTESPSDGRRNPASTYCTSEEINGENFFSTAAKAVLRVWDGKTADTVVLAASNTHANTILGTAYASPLNAPVLPVKSEGVPEAIEHALLALKPTRIAVFDCGGVIPSLVNHLRAINDAWSIDLFDTPDIFDSSLSLLSSRPEDDKGLDSVILVDFDENPESFAILPYARRKKAPIIMTSGHEPKDPSALESFIRSKGASRIIALGPISNSDALADLEAKGISVKRINESSSALTCLEICRFTQNQEGFSADTLCVASHTAGQWPDLLACGSLCAHEKCALLLEESSDLDSIAACLDFVHETKPKKLVFLGGMSGLSELDRKMIANEACEE